MRPHLEFAGIFRPLTKSESDGIGSDRIGSDQIGLKKPGYLISESIPTNNGHAASLDQDDREVMKNVVVIALFLLSPSPFWVKTYCLLVCI